jgi:hypothetical protein
VRIEDERKTPDESLKSLWALIVHPYDEKRFQKEGFGSTVEPPEEMRRLLLAIIPRERGRAMK